MTTATIVAATEEGRVVYSNIRRFIKYILGPTSAKYSPLLLRQSCWGRSALTPLNSLDEPRHRWFTGFGFGSRAARPNVMRRPPFNPKRASLRGLGSYMVHRDYFRDRHDCDDGDCLLFPQ